MTLNRYITVFVVLTSAFLNGCTVKEERIIEKQVEVKQAPENALESFSNPLAVPGCQRASCITIQKKSLGKIFLLLASGKTAGSTPQWYDLKPLVVSFEKAGSKMALLAENYNSIYEEIRTVNLLQTFEVVSEDSDSVTFDWGQGLKTFILQSPYDIDGPRGMNEELTESSYKSLPVVDSFVRGIKFDEKNIELEQISKVRTDDVKPTEEKSLKLVTREETLAMNVQIRSYNLAAGFNKKPFDSSRRVGFFVTKVSKKGYSQDTTNLITKWDLSASKGPIVVRVSAAVPAEYLGAIEEGALYWNKVFGRDVITVKTGVDPQAAPEDRSIFVRWIPWLDSGAAYAIGQSDPLTGELLRAQVFMPSVFTRVGSADLVHLNGNVPVVAVGAVACDLTHGLKEINKLAMEASDSQRLRLAQDSVRATVAHELGHALGMRHNFAGSFSAKVSTQEILESAKTYLKNPNHQGLETTTSIMDYVSGIDDVLAAARIKYAPLSYDKMAMDWAYSQDDKALDEKISRYCTDDDISLATSQGMQIYGCERFDAGNNPLQRKYLDALSEKNLLVKVLFTSIIGRAFPGDDPSKVVELSSVLKDTLKWGRANLDALQFVGQVVMETSQSGVATPEFMSLDNIKNGNVTASKLGVDDALAKERQRSLKDVGGYAAMVNSLWRDADGSVSLNWFEKQIEELKNSPYLAKGKTLAGREYQFTVEEQAQILKFFGSLTKLNRSVLSAGIAQLLPKIDEPKKGEKGARILESSLLPTGFISEEESAILADLYLDLTEASTAEKSLKVGAGLSKEVKVALPALSVEERALWTKLLSSKGLRFSMDMKKALVRNSQFEKVNSFLKEVDANLDLNSVKDIETLPAQLASQGLLDAEGVTWLSSEIKVLKALDKVL